MLASTRPGNPVRPNGVYIRRSCRFGSLRMEEDRMIRLAFTVALCALLTGCAVKRYSGPMQYEYRRMDLVVPPGAVLPSKQKVDVKLGKARLGKKRGASCEI